MEYRQLSMKENSEYLGVCREKISKCLANRNFLGHQVEKNWKFKASEVDLWVRSQNA